MARGIYEIKLKEPYFPATSETEAVEMLKTDDIKGCFDSNSIEVSMVASEEDTMKMFILAKTMYDTDKFDCFEVGVAVEALARKMGYFSSANKIAECVIEWVEKFDEMTLSELQEWIIG